MEGMGGGGPFGLMMGCKRREYKTCWSYIHILYVCICMVHGNVPIHPNGCINFRNRSGMLYAAWP